MAVEGFVEPGPPPPSIVNPEWLRKPTGEDLTQYYPEAAQREALDGRATISCAVSEAGDVERCSVISESPEGYGFGQAALKLSPLFKMRPKSQDGIPVEGSVRIPIVFRIPEAPAPQPYVLQPADLAGPAVGLGAAVVLSLLLLAIYAWTARRRT